MKSSARDKAEGKMHQAKGRVKQALGVIAGDSNLEAKGKKENLGGKDQEKRGQIKTVLDK